MGDKVGDLARNLMIHDYQIKGQIIENEQGFTRIYH